eukprot:15037606-Alexandrium_andersonii.AAC.1
MCIRDRFLGFCGSPIRAQARSAAPQGAVLDLRPRVEVLLGDAVFVGAAELLGADLPDGVRAAG